MVLEMSMPRSTSETTSSPLPVFGLHFPHLDNGVDTKSVFLNPFSFCWDSSNKTFILTGNM